MSETITCVGCARGRVALQVQGRPIVSCECLCTDCQRAGELLQAVTARRAILDKNGATRYELYRKDRVRCNQGQELLREHRLTPDSKTRRVIASCCSTPMFLEFAGGHWLSIYGALWSAENLPPLELRTMTRSRAAGTVLPDDVPNPATHTFSFYAKLFAAWAAMGFRTPKLPFLKS